MKLHEEYRDINKRGIIGVADKMIGQLEDYVTNRKMLPEQANGICILVDGQAVVKSCFDER